MKMLFSLFGMVLALTAFAAGGDSGLSLVRSHILNDLSVPVEPRIESLRLQDVVVGWKKQVRRYCERVQDEICADVPIVEQRVRLSVSYRLADRLSNPDFSALRPEIVHFDFDPSEIDAQVLRQLQGAKRSVSNQGLAHAEFAVEIGELRSGFSESTVDSLEYLYCLDPESVRDARCEGHVLTVERNRSQPVLRVFRKL